MKKIVYLFFLHLVFFSCLAEAQTPKPRIPREPSTTRYFKDMYLYVKEKIRKNQYYINEFQLNSHALRWKDDKVRQKSYQFYYSFWGDNTPLLRLAVLTQTVGMVETRLEFLYDQDGNLGLCVEKQNDENFAYREFQVFYEKELCINLILDKNIIDPKDTKPHQAKIDEFKRLGKEVYLRFAQDQASAER